MFDDLSPSRCTKETYIQNIFESNEFKDDETLRQNRNLLWRPSPDRILVLRQILRSKMHLELSTEQLWPKKTRGLLTSQAS